MGRGVFAGGSVALHGAGLASFPTLNPIPGLAVCTHYGDRMSNCRSVDVFWQPVDSRGWPLGGYV